MIRIAQSFLNEQQLPVVWQAVDGRSAGIETVAGWLAEQQPVLDALLERHGAVVLRGFEAIDSAAAFSRVLDVVAPQLMDYIGGTAPRHAVHGRILTSTDLPQNYTLALHQEMAYTANPPDGVAFFCEIAAASGGETTVADARRVTRAIDPGVLARFEAQGVRVRRTLPAPESIHKKPGIPKPWTEVFDTAEPSEVDRIAAEKGWEINWLPDRSLQLWQEHLPGFKTHPRTGERVWFNQAHYHTPECTLLWALRDGRHEQAEQIRAAMTEHPEMLDVVFHGDGTPVSAADSEHLWNVLVDAEVPLPWQPGDVLLLDNVLAMHGRRQFVGDRRVLAALIRRPATAPAAALPRQAAVA